MPLPGHAAALMFMLGPRDPFISFLQCGSPEVGASRKCRPPRSTAAYSARSDSSKAPNVALRPATARAAAVACGRMQPVALLSTAGQSPAGGRAGRNIRARRVLRHGARPGSRTLRARSCRHGAGAERRSPPIGSNRRSSASTPVRRRRARLAAPIM